MLMIPYRLDELSFAWCNRIYFRTRTHRRKVVPHLASLDKATLSELLKPYGIQVLEFFSAEHELRGMLSLTATETTSSAISKTKGRISKWVSQYSARTDNPKTLAKGYFALTTGQPTTDAVAQYLESQPVHHGYIHRARPPVYLRDIEHAGSSLDRIQAEHSITRLRYHIVLSVTFRNGVFHADSAEAVTNRWQECQDQCLVDKVSFVPDHVHIAVSLHPALSPAQVACQLMNEAQSLMWDQFETSVLRAKVARLWQPSAYIGSFGDLSSNAVAAYIRRWSELDESI